MKELDYWRECLSTAAEECGATLTAKQLDSIAEDVRCGHECYGMAFYSPPASDRISAVNSEWAAKYDALEREFRAYRENAECAVKIALRQYDDTIVSIQEHGEVLRHDGRTERIQ